MARRRQIPDGLRERVFSQTGHACYYCGAYATEIDHAVPYSYSQNDSERNLVPACWICNRIAGNKHFDNLNSKKNYILEQRSTLKWKRRIDGMQKTLIAVDAAVVDVRTEPKKKEKKNKRAVEKSSKQTDVFIRPQSKITDAKRVRPQKNSPPKEVQEITYTQLHYRDEVEEIMGLAEYFDFLSDDEIKKIRSILERAIDEWHTNVLGAFFIANVNPFLYNRPLVTPGQFIDKMIEQGYGCHYEREYLENAATVQ